MADKIYEIPIRCTEIMVTYRTKHLYAYPFPNDLAEFGDNVSHRSESEITGTICCELFDIGLLRSPA